MEPGSFSLRFSPRRTAAPTLQEQEQTKSQWQNPRLVHTGAASTVTLCRGEDGVEVACKAFANALLLPRHKLNLRREISILSHLRTCGTRGVVELLETDETPDSIMLVFRACSGGDLYHSLKQQTWDEARLRQQVVTPLLRVLTELHAMGYVHRDIKPENIFFTEDGTLQLGDFGLSIDQRHERPISRVGTLDYMAPEVLAQPSSTEAASLHPCWLPCYDEKVDVWGVGVLVMEALTGHAPFAHLNPKIAALKARFAEPPPLPEGTSAACHDFVCRALCRDPRQRASTADLLNHPWILAATAVTAKTADRCSSSAPACDAVMPPTPLPLASVSIGVDPSVPASAQRSSSELYGTDSLGSSSVGSFSMSLSPRRRAAPAPLLPRPPALSPVVFTADAFGRHSPSLPLSRDHSGGFGLRTSLPRVLNTDEPQRHAAAARPPRRRNTVTSLSERTRGAADPTAAIASPSLERQQQQPQHHRRHSSLPHIVCAAAPTLPCSADAAEAPAAALGLLRTHRAVGAAAPVVVVPLVRGGSPRGFTVPGDPVPTARHLPQSPSQRSIRPLLQRLAAEPAAPAISSTQNSSCFVAADSTEGDDCTVAAWESCHDSTVYVAITSTTEWEPLISRSTWEPLVTHIPLGVAQPPLPPVCTSARVGDVDDAAAVAAGPADVNALAQAAPWRRQPAISPAALKLKSWVKSMFTRQAKVAHAMAVPA